MNAPSPVRRISDTALWVAVYRAEESERSDAVFHDRYARTLAADRGAEIAAAMAFARRHAWSYTARTWLVDRIIESSVARGTDMLINLAAGLDARPYRMALPASLKWVEVDLPEMLTYKQEMLAAEHPVCALDRVALDLRDVSARREFFQRLGAEAKQALIVTEGLLIYFDAEEVGALAHDLAAPVTFKRWVTDLTSPALLRMLQRSMGGLLAEADSPLKFAPSEGPEFFARYGWKALETRSLLHTAAKLNRLSFGLRLLSLLPDPAGRKPDRPWGGICVFENSGAGNAEHARQIIP
ncbi:MAG: class I SAM-dependent methyltransferase [Steroidobacteraceae bacterium]